MFDIWIINGADTSKNNCVQLSIDKGVRPTLGGAEQWQAWPGTAGRGGRGQQGGVKVKGDFRD